MAPQYVWRVDILRAAGVVEGCCSLRIALGTDSHQHLPVLIQQGMPPIRPRFRVQGGEIQFQAAVQCHHGLLWAPGKMFTRHAGKDHGQHAPGFPPRR